MKANILRIFSSFLRYNKHTKLFVQRWHHFWSSKIDHYFTKQRISIKNVEILSLCKVGHFGIYKNPNGIICSIVLKKKGENNTTEELSPLSVFFKAGRVANSGQWLSKYFFIYQTPADFISHEEYVMWKCFVYCKILSLFILLIHLYYVRFFFTFILPKNFAGTWQGAGVKTTGMKAEFIIKLLVSFLKKYELNSYVFCVVLCLFWKIMSHQVAFLQRVKFLELP